MTPNKRYGHQAFVVRADVYNLSTNSWRDLDTVPIRIVSSQYRIERAESLNHGSRGENSVTVLEESLTLISSISGYPKLFSLAYDCNTSIEVWVMKEYGVGDSWTKKFSIAPLPEINRQLSFWDNDEEPFIEIRNGELISWYLRNGQELRKYQMYERPTNYGFPTYLSVVTYTESLISLNAERNHCLLLPPSQKV
ncbi:uncharacterized protein LOC113771473 [Coffea eugenioides]|uniref:uncharacterized protein LOC113771473 n=1 Tax=Coffea eugenioides TaxID=49369 RepID=UPI000F60944B|nr:uncharacterized protein LOC113771473 [Coffea eugenioides]